MTYFIGKEECMAVEKVINSGILERYIDPDSSAVLLFEKDFALKIGSNYCLTVNSGTSALICALRASGIKNDDEVIIPSYTYIATALAVLAVGAKPVIANIDDSLTISPNEIEFSITKRTKAIIPVHMNGLPCKMDQIMKIAKKFNLLVIEDVAQACGGEYKNRKLGSIGDLGIFSFNHHKIISCGEGGAVVTNSERYITAAHVIHHGGVMFEDKLEKIEFPTLLGYNYRLSEISGSILNVQLSRLDYFLSSLRKEKTIITEKLESIKNKKFSINSVNDRDGDCSSFVFINFFSKELAIKFLKLASENNINVRSPLSKGHFCEYWQKLFKNQKQTVIDHNATIFNNQYLTLSKSILERTVGIPTSIDRGSRVLDLLLEKIQYAMEML